MFRPFLVLSAALLAAGCAGPEQRAGLPDGGEATSLSTPVARGDPRAPRHFGPGTPVARGTAG